MECSRLEKLVSSLVDLCDQCDLSVVESVLLGQVSGLWLSDFSLDISSSGQSLGLSLLAQVLSL